MIGRTLGHYEIVSLIGRGGMGEVYRALDTRLKRDVALKILRADLAADPARLERFQREAETVASLNHPHIVTVFSVEEADGVRFLTMELVEGQTLDALLPAGGLPLTKVLEIGIAVADALAAAHEKGVVHRDLKPANVMIANDGRIKVLDFGLAKLARAPVVDAADTQTSPITVEGAVIGTVLHMSPEQLRGQDVDHRSDIFSLGIMLYQLAIGHRPFAGDTNSDIASSTLRDTPTPLDQLRPDLPYQLAHIVSQCLEKDVHDRYHSAADVRNELRALRRAIESGAVTRGTRGRRTSVAARTERWRAMQVGLVAVFVVAAVGVAILMHGRSQRASTQRAGLDEHSIAVLPFVDMSAEGDQEYFSDGISEELLNLLAQIPSLKVAARTSSFSFKGKDADVPEIARRLNVSHVLEGSVRRSGNRVRITAQLNHADGYHAWSRTYDRTLDDIFAIQDEIAADVVKQLQLTLLGVPPTARRTDPDAYGLYLQAIQLERQSTVESLRRSESLFKRALDLDSTYAPAWDRLSDTYIAELSLGMIENREGLARIREASSRALAIDPDYAAPYGRLAWVEIYGNNDIAAGAGYLQRALALDPTDPLVLAACSALLESLGRMDEGLRIDRFLVERDPLNPSKHFIFGITLRRMGRFDQAIESFRTALVLSPNRGGAYYQISVAMLLKGDAQGALTEIEQESDEVWKIIGRPLVDYALGNKGQSDAALDRVIRTYGEGASSNIAAIYAFRGEPDPAFDWLEKAVVYNDPGVYEIGDNLYANLHADPRWIPFLSRIGRAPEQLAEIHFKVLLPSDAQAELP